MSRSTLPRLVITAEIRLFLHVYVHAVLLLLQKAGWDAIAGRGGGRRGEGLLSLRTHETSFGVQSEQDYIHWSHQPLQSVGPIIELNSSLHTHS